MKEIMKETLKKDLSSSSDQNYMKINKTKSWIEPTTTMASSPSMASEKYTPQPIKLLGKEVIFNSYLSNDIVLMLTLVNFSGILFYKNLKDNFYRFPIELQTYLDNELTIYERNNSISKILD